MKTNFLWDSFRSRIINNGFKDAFTKFIHPFEFKKILGYYLDILGVLDGAYAYKSPDFLQIDLTNNCNNDCIGCWCNSPLLGEQKINSDVKQQTLFYRKVLELIDTLSRSGVRHIYYAGGGEPFMHPHIMEILAHTKKRGLECHVNTNFTLLDEEKVKILAGLQINSLTVSIWAGTARIYSATHPNKGEEAFYKIRETLKLLNSIKHKLPIIKVYNVIFNMNYQEIEEMVKFALETKSEMIEFTVIDTMPGKTDKLLLNDAQRKVLLKECQRVKEKYEKTEFKNRIHLFGFEQFMRRISNLDAEVANYDSDIISKIPCYAGWAFARILADGNLNSCLKSHRFPVGNILKQKFSRAWNGQLQRYFRQKTLRLEKSDPLFSLIGNDPGLNMGCYKSCDNIGHNLYMHKKMTSLSSFEKYILKGIANILKLTRLKNQKAEKTITVFD